MTFFQGVTLLFSVGALTAFLSEKCLRLPIVAGILLFSFCGSLLIGLFGYFGIDFLYAKAVAFLLQIDFGRAVLEGMLCFFLFMGGLHLRLHDIEQERGILVLLSTLTTLVTAFVIGGLFYFLFSLIGKGVSFTETLLLGAILAPTGPIVILAMLREIGLPHRLDALMTGESLFNDGVSVALFFILFGPVTQGAPVPVVDFFFLIGREIIGGILLGLIIALIAQAMLRKSSDHSVRIAITFASVLGTYALGGVLGVSGPIGVVVLGIIIGHITHKIFKEAARRELVRFWQLIDELLVGILFVLIGFTVLVLPFPWRDIWILPLAIAIALFARYLGVFLSVALGSLHQKFSVSKINLVNLLTWGGLRGAVSLALAMSLPLGMMRDLFLIITYSIVLFSLLIQGPLLAKFFTTKELKGISEAERSSSHAKKR